MLWPNDPGGWGAAAGPWHLCCTRPQQDVGEAPWGSIHDERKPAMRRGLFALLAALSLFAASIASAQDSYSQQQQQSTTDAQSQSQTQDPAPADNQATTTDASSTTSSLPATASPLPLLGFVGLLTLAAGVWVIRARRRA